MVMQLLVGVGVLIYRDNKVLLGKRKGSHGAATWALPGGHLEAGESVESCAIRETTEETGIVVGHVTRAGYSSDIFANESKHYVTLFVEAHATRGAPAILETDKCDAWAWFAWDDMPKALFAPFQSLLAQGFQPLFKCSTGN